jgi:F-type H+-transporting ATPase subunit delta
MADLTTIARPYARALFDLARPEDRAGWSEMLTLLATIVTDETLRPVLADPALSRTQKADLVLDICGDQLSTEAYNVVRLLADNKRLEALPEIAEVYETLRAEAEKTLVADLISAFEISKQQRKQIAVALSNRLKRKVELNCQVDESLLGGTIIRAGDLVIDGSARSHLNKLAVNLRL